MIKKVIIFSLTLTIFLLLPKTTHAQVVINELSTATSSDWIELYSPDDLDISNWIIRDEATTIVATLPPSTSIGPSTSEFLVIEAGNRFNNSGDTIKLLQPDDSTLIDQITYGNSGGVCKPSDSGSIGRYPDANSTIERFSEHTKNTSNGSATLDPCVVPTEVPTNTPTTEEQHKATYIINEAKDENGNTLSSVKIYIDNVYVHHYAPETLTFCSDCNCNGYVDCKFGNHTVKLEKSGYESWSETVDITQGSSLQANPVLVQVQDKEENTNETEKELETEAIISNTKTDLGTEIGVEKEDIDIKPLVLGIEGEDKENDNPKNNFKEDEKYNFIPEENDFPVPAMLLMLGGGGFLAIGGYKFFHDNPPRELFKLIKQSIKHNFFNKKTK